MRADLARDSYVRCPRMNVRVKLAGSCGAAHPTWLPETAGKQS